MQRHMIIFYILYFAQACQGVQFDAGVAVNTTDAKGDLPMDQDIQVHKIPSEADFLIAYSVVPGMINHLSYDM